MYVGSLGPAERDKILREAYALLHPINFNEPFGLSIIESMACGTPVIAFNKGSMPEIIENSHNGFLVSDVNEAADACNNIPSIDRLNCRKTVENKFTADMMVENYIKVYNRILKRKQ